MFKFHTMQFPYFQKPEGDSGPVFHDDNNADKGDENVELEEETGDDDTDDNEGDENETGEEEEDKGDKDKDTKGEEDDLVRHSLSDINKEFPEFFKKFPSLKHAFFREQRFSEIFPTVEDAQTAADQQAAFLEISEAVTTGDTDRFIKELKGADDKALETFSANYLESLKKENKEVYFDLLTPIVSGLIKNVYKHGLSKKDENIQKAAKILHRELIGGDYADVENDTPAMTRSKGSMRGESDKDDNGTEKGLSEEQNRKYINLRGEISTTLVSSLEAEIAKGLDDVKGRDGLKKVAIKEIRERVLAEMAKDTNYTKRMDSLWSREARLGFNGSLKESFKTNYMGKARVLIPKIRAEVRKELLNDIKGGTEDKEPNRHTGGSRSSGGNTKITSQMAKEKGMSSRDVFNA